MHVPVYIKSYTTEIFVTITKVSNSLDFDHCCKSAAALIVMIVQ